MIRHTLAACAAALIAAASAPVAAQAQSGQATAAPASSANLRVGASRVDITPSAAELPQNYTGVNDNVVAMQELFRHESVMQADGKETDRWVAMGVLPHSPKIARLRQNLKSQLSRDPVHV